MNWAWENRELDRQISFNHDPGRQGSHGRERVLSIPEMTRLWETEMPDYVKVFIALAIDTGARPEAILELTSGQCDLDRGVIDLNPCRGVPKRKTLPARPAGCSGCGRS